MKIVNDYILDLITQANKMGAMGYRVIGWNPPQSAKDDPCGNLLFVKEEISSATETSWYKK